MTAKDMGAVIDNLTSDVARVKLSGGEPMTRRRRLNHALSLLQKRQDKLKGFIVELQTNGSWVSDVERTYKILKDLYDRGVTVINFGSVDIFHKEQGLDYWKRINIDNHKGPLVLARNKLSDVVRKFNPIMFTKTDVGSTGIAVGRAKNLPEKNKRKGYNCNASPSNLTVDLKGLVYVCCHNMPSPIGSLVDESLDGIMKRVRSDDILKKLCREFTWPEESKVRNQNLVDTAKSLGTYEKKDAMVYREDPCSVCEKVFKDIKFC